MQPIGLRREDKSEWEVRVPLVPEHVGRLIRDAGVPVCVQSNPRRVFPDDEYAAQGAQVVDSLKDCPVILGVKEVPEAIFERGKTYVFFSHTIKGQDYNMAMLRKMMELECSLIDYERITDDAGRRLVFFGQHAGLAGMIDALWSLGQRFAVEGRETPLANITPAHRYSSLDEAQSAIRDVVEACRKSDSLSGLGPLVFGFAGYGQVSQGAQRIFDLFEPHVIEPDALMGLDSRGNDGKFVKVVFKECDMVRPRQDGAPFELQEYYKHPERYDGVFERYLSHLTVLMNCIYWEDRYPRLVSLDALNGLYGTYGRAPQPRLRVIGDISCDVGGAIECTVRATEPGNPVYVYDVARHEAIDGFKGNGPVVLAVDILPTELPREASQSFSDALVDMIPGLASATPTEQFADWQLPNPMKRATILHRGKLTPDYEYIREYL